MVKMERKDMKPSIREVIGKEIDKFAVYSDKELDVVIAALNSIVKECIGEDEPEVWSKGEQEMLRAKLRNTAKSEIRQAWEKRLE